MAESKVFMFNNSDPDMQRAYQKARATFRYFWREMAWERRRIVPALGLPCVKAPFADGEPRQQASENPDVEQMWIDEVDFDGEDITGVLLNEPNWLKSVKAGDPVRISLEEISDWMYALDGEVYGAFTVNLMRSRMSRGERQEHDAAWGLNFGDPKQIRLVPAEKKGFFKSLFGGGNSNPEKEEHPMSEAMAAPLKEQLAQNPSMLHQTDDLGRTFLHQQAMAGSVATVQVLLDHGADVNARTANGKTPLQLAQILGWDKVVALLASKGGK